MEYWDGYYKSGPVSKTPSSFALFCSQYLKKDNVIVDVGCGDGHDSYYFKSLGLGVIGIEQSKVACENNIKRYPGINFINSRVKEIFSAGIAASSVDHVYCRFVIHSLVPEDQERFISWAYEVLKPNGYLHIECRSVWDPMYGVGEKGPDPDSFINGHYRRFIDMQGLYDQVQYLHNFTVIYGDHNNNLSVVGNDNPVLIRCIAQKFVEPRPKHNYLMAYSKHMFVDFLKMCAGHISIIAVCGTLLGAVRHKGLVPWDTDIDIAIMLRDLPLLINHLRNKGFRMSSARVGDGVLIDDSFKVESYFDIEKELVWISKNTLYMQLHFFLNDTSYKPLFWSDYGDEKFVVHYVDEFKYLYDDGRYNIPQSLFYPLQTVPFYDTYIFVPNKVVEVLQKWYGKDCLINYPKSTHGDIDRFLSSDNKIKDFSPA